MTRFPGWQNKKSGTNKFGAQKTEYNGNKYDSKSESLYALTLDIKRKADDPDQKVLKVERQVLYEVVVESVLICKYYLDFRVTYHDRIECIDVKGYKKGAAYQVFRIKKKLVEAIYGIKILEITL